MSMIEASKETSRLSLVKKLLAKADSDTTPAERDALVERAAELMAKYGIDEAMLAAADGGSGKIVDKVIFVDRPFTELMVTLLYNSPPRSAPSQRRASSSGTRTKGISGATRVRGSTASASSRTTPT